MDRNQRLDRLSGLLPAQFAELVFKLKVPPQYLSQGVGQAAMAAEVIRFLEQDDRVAEIDVYLSSVPRAEGLLASSPSVTRVVSPDGTIWSGSVEKTSHTYAGREPPPAPSAPPSAFPILTPDSGSVNESTAVRQDNGVILGGRYRIIRHVGSGGMSDVYQAVHTRLNQNVAIKFILPTFMNHPEIVQRFFREGKALASLQGDDIVQVFDLGLDGQRPYLVMEWLKGDTLEDRLIRSGPLDIEAVADILGRVLRGLSRAHALGIVHRDIKPSNIFIGERGTNAVKLIDFGIAGMREHRETPFEGLQLDALHRLTHVGAVMGTLNYMSPEQFRGDHVDSRSDLWQVAIVAFECLLGKNPLDTERRVPSLAESYFAATQVPLPVPSSHGRAPNGFDEWFAKATEKDPAQRFQSADEMARGLFALIGQGWILDAGYRPYPEDLVLELEGLTKEREYRTRKVSPVEEDKRRKRIDHLVIRLKRTPVAGDVVVGAKLVRIIGKGNYGSVWEAINEKDGSHVAVKAFDSDRLGMGSHLYHFRRGVRAMERLNETIQRPPAVIALHNVEKSGLAYSMTYLNDGDLTSFAQRGWKREKKLEVFATICEAVAFAHENGVLHRDIKPANIVMHNGAPVLTDFDTADLLFVKTLSTQSVGTIAYAAPEQLNEQARRDATGDIYSLGRLLHFFLLEKDPPLWLEKVPTLTDLAGAHPKGLVDIIRRCTMGDPGARYQKVSGLLRDLRRFQSSARR